MISIAKSEDHPIDVVLVWKFSRFARNQEESIVYKSMLKKDGVEVISISEPLIDGPFGSLIERIIEWMDEYYSIRLSGEVHRGMKEKALKSGYQTKPTLGYSAVGEGKPFVINEDEYKIVDYIFNQFDQHDTDSRQIALQLNEMGFRTRQGLLFDVRSINRILKNPFYYGLVVWNDVEFMGTHEVRLTKEQFEKRMEKLNKRHKQNRRNVSSCTHWLTGILKCGYCGASMTFNSLNRSPYFQCWKYAKGLHKESISINEKKVIEAVYEYFEHILGGGEFEYTYIAPEATEMNAERNTLMEELEKISSREARISLAFEKGIDTLEEYAENKKRLRMAREELEKQLEMLNNTSVSTGPTKEEVMNTIKNVYEIIKNPDVGMEVKGNVMRDLFEKIVYDKENKRFIFYLQFS